MTMIMAVLHLLLLTGSAWMAFEFYATDFTVPHMPDVMRMITYLGVVGISVVWALVHVVGGGILGVTGGSILEGLKMGIILGVAISLGRLWMYALVVGLIALFFAPGLVPGVTILIFAAVCLSLQIFTSFIWSKASPLN